LPDPKSLARELIRREWMTPYQANQLLQGKGQDLLLGSFVLLERLGEGGMGQVFKARNWKLGQIVALKLLKQLNNPQLVQRFQREIRVAAQLDHPNIIRAFDADCAGDVHFLVMEFVPGIDLGRLVRKDGQLPVAQACDFMRQSALGLHHAFERGLVHRDIKPANLLLTGNGLIKILDMGLARLGDNTPTEDDESTALTRQGVVMGTVDYMAPEQAMNFHSADIRADLYSLGCTFYFLLAGRVPFPGGEALARLLRHREEDPQPIEALRPDVPASVGQIVRKMMAKKPENRYQTPGELAAALQGALSGPVPVVASRAVTCTEELAIETDPAGGPTDAGGTPSPGKKKRRVPWLAGAGAVLGAVLIVVLLRSWQGSGQPVNPPANNKEEPAENTSVWGERFKQVPMDLREWQDAVEGLGGTALAGLLTIVGEGKTQHWGAIQRVVYSPQGNLLVSGGAEGEIKVWDAGKGRLLTRLQAHQDAILGIGFSADGQTLTSVGKDAQVHVWDVTTWQKQRTLPIRPANPSQAALTSDGGMLAVASQSGNVRLWVLPGLVEQPTLSLHSGAITALTFSPRGKLLASVGPEQEVVVWDLKANKAHVRLPRPAGAIQFLSFHPKGQMLAGGYAGLDGLIKLWDLQLGEEDEDLYKAGISAWHGAFSPNGKLLAVTGGYGTRLWDVTLNRYIRAWPGGALAFSPDSKTVASAPGHLVEFQDVAGTKVRPPFPEYPALIQCVASHPASQTVAWGTHDGTIMLLGPGDQSVRSLRERQENVEQLVFSPDGRVVASRNADKRLRAWIVKTGEPFLDPGYTDVRGFAFINESKSVLVWTGATLRRWDLVSGKDLTMVGPPLSDARSMTLSPDGRVLTLGTTSGGVRLWDLQSAREKQVLTEKDLEPTFLVYRPDGKTLISNHASNQVKRWDLFSGKKEANLKETAPCSCALFSPRGTILATGHSDGAVRLWDADSGALRDTLQICPKAGKIVQIAFLDDNHLATVNSNGTLYVLLLKGREKA
jgi:WD40 repeat protein/serine/threonine protein kinase